jgi:diaminopimelate epimerase
MIGWPEEMHGLAFLKYEGIGNDFVLVEAEHEDRVPTALARALCDRHFGVGGDGALVVTPGRGRTDARMRVINADGSVPEMCGNGLRCAALHVARRRGIERGVILFETDAGERSCSIDDQGGKGLVTVDMGIVRHTGDVRISLGEDAWELALADAGNPHAITTVSADRETIDRVGPQLATHATFPHGTNVEFASFADSTVRLVVWERGVGVTLACGTGACATVAVGVSKGWLPAGVPVAVTLPGGRLDVTIKDDGRAMMCGPARHVFSGEYTGGVPA